MLYRIVFLLSLLVVGCSSQYDKYEEIVTLPSTFNKDTINRYLLTTYKNVCNEQIHIIYYKNNRSISDEVAASGTKISVTTNGLQIIADCTLKKCDHIVFAHNHPGQYWAKASSIDLDGADKLKEMMEKANITPMYVIIGEADANWLY
jgi:DNA repair protein RadC